MREKKVQPEATIRKIKTPNVPVDVPINIIRKNFGIKEPLVEELSRYTAFLSEHYGKAISEDKVIEGLLQRFKADKLYTEWKRKNNYA